MNSATAMGIFHLYVIFFICSQRPYCMIVLMFKECFKAETLVVLMVLVIVIDGDCVGGSYNGSGFFY